MNTALVFTSLIISVVLGGFLVTYLKQTNKAHFIKLMLAFSGGFLLSVAFVHFIPDLYSDHTGSIGIFILIGFLIQLLLEFFSGGIEHGHVHAHEGQTMPWGLFISLSIHSVLEGIPLGNQLIGVEIHDHHDHGGSSLLLGILFHQLPVSIALMTLLINTRLTQIRAWVVLMLFGIMTPAGVVYGMLFPGTFFDYHIILAVVVGMFLHISTTIIFETSENHKFNLMKLIAIFIGCLLAFGLI